MTFTYTTNYNNYEQLLQQEIKNCICKHVMRLNSEKSRKVFEESNNIGYERAMWGYTAGIWKNPEYNRIIQINTIQKMIYKKFNRQFRIVIDKYKTPWIDNMHSAIRDILVYGEHVKLKDVKCYIIDMSEEIPIVVNIDNTIFNNIRDIEGCIQSSINRLNRINKTLIDINYTIGEFMEENEINIDALTIDKKFLIDYKQQI